MFSNVFVFNNKPQVNYSIVSFEYFIVDVTQNEHSPQFESIFYSKKQSCLYDGARTTLFQELWFFWFSYFDSREERQIWIDIMILDFS